MARVTSTRFSTPPESPEGYQRVTQVAGTSGKPVPVGDRELQEEILCTLQRIEQHLAFASDEHIEDIGNT